MEDSEIGGGRGGRGGDGDRGTVGAGCGNIKLGDPLIDRSKVKILLCDNDTKSATEVLELLCKCSYQVTSVRSARQVIDALNAEGFDIDVILAEVDLPMKKGMKMLKYITRDKEFQRIPVIMMSAQDEVSVVVKCLRLGAADYLVKPLRTNELLNLWTHMWRRRQTLGLVEKNILNHDFDLMASDPSDANTNSTTLFSDDTDEKSRKSSISEMTVQAHQEDELNNPALDPMHEDSYQHQPDMAEISNWPTGTCPKKSELKTGESSAFFSYVKSSLFKANSQAGASDENTTSSPIVDDRSKAWRNPVRNNTTLRYEHGELELVEKNILNHDSDLMASDPSDPYTNSTTLFSDDTDEKSRKSSIPEMTVQAHQEDELNNPAPDPMHADSYEYQPDMAEISNWPTGQCFSCPKKSELKTGRGESSAFFSYVKPSLFKANSHAGASDGKNTTTSSPIVDDISKEAWRNHLRNNTTLRYEHGEACENNSQGDEFTSSTCSFPNSTPPPPPPASLGLLQNKSSAEGLTSPVHVQHPPRNGTQFDIAGFSAHAAYPYYTRGGMNEPPMMITTYQQDLQSHAATSAVAPHFNHLGLPSFPYYPVGMGMGMGMRLQPSQMPSFGSSNSRETKPNTVDRREAALVKFRQKRKDRCFDKKIMYANRKRLAERMPRVRGQFVRKVNGVMVDLYGLAEYDDEEEEEDDIDPSSSS